MNKFTLNSLTSSLNFIFCSRSCFKSTSDFCSVWDWFSTVWFDADDGGGGDVAVSFGFCSCEDVLVDECLN